MMYHFRFWISTNFFVFRNHDDAVDALPLHEAVIYNLAYVCAILCVVRTTQVGKALRQSTTKTRTTKAGTTKGNLKGVKHVTNFAGGGGLIA
jgi:hypothetical protein